MESLSLVSRLHNFSGVRKSLCFFGVPIFTQLRVMGEDGENDTPAVVSTKGHGKAVAP